MENFNKTTLRKTSQSHFVDTFLNNENYFSAENKRHFNVQSITCYCNDTDTVGLLHEVQGKYLIQEGKRDVIKIAFKRDIITLDNGFNNKYRGLEILELLRDTFKSLGNREKNIINNLVKIDFNQDDQKLIFIKDVAKKSCNDYFSLFLNTESIN